MATTATRFAGPSALTSASTTLFTVPAGHRYLVREVRTVNTHATQAVGFAVGINGTGAAARIIEVGSVAALSQFSDTGWFVVNAGDTLDALKLSGAGTMAISVHGYDLLT